nr:SH3 domain-containing protein [Prolixibacteraceae bacterium]
MKNLFKRIGLFLFLVTISTLISAQTLSYKNILTEIQTIQKQLVPDKRVNIFDISIKDTLKSLVVISGETSLPEGKKHLISFLEEKEIPFIDSIRVLPDSAAGDKTWALAKLSVSNMRYLPDHTSELVSQVLMGTPMKVLDYKKGWYRIQTPDNYIGWMDAGGIQCLTQSEFEHWKGAKRWIYNSISGYIYDSPNKNGEIVADLVLNDILEAEGESKGFLKVIIPDGRKGYIRKKECISIEEWSSRQPDTKNLLSLPQKMMGTPYIWGGASVRAVDCSGFVKIAYFSQGILLARDASQQARYGEVIDFHNPENLKPGDLLFFGRDDK